MSAVPSAPGRQRYWPKLLVRVVLGLVFLWAGAEKIAHTADFFSSLLDYDVPFPETFLRLVAVALPWLEVFCGTGLLVNAWGETVRPVVAARCLVFIAMLGQALLRGIDISNCGCFGPVANTWIDRPAVAFLRAVLLFAGGALVLATTTDPSYGGTATILLGTGSDVVFGGTGSDSITAGAGLSGGSTSNTPPTISTIANMTAVTGVASTVSFPASTPSEKPRP